MESPQEPGPAIVLSVGGPTGPASGTIVGPHGACQVVFEWPSRLGIGGSPETGTHVFAGLRTDTLERVLHAQVELGERNEAPLVGVATPRQIPTEMQARPDNAALLLYDARTADSAIGVLMPEATVFGAHPPALLWLCADSDDGREPLDRLADALTHHAALGAGITPPTVGPSPGAGFGPAVAGVRLPDLAGML